MSSPGHCRGFTEFPERKRPLITIKDVAWLLYVYPLRWLSSVIPARAVRFLGRMAVPLCQLVTRRDKERMVTILRRALGSEPSEAELRHISRQWVSNGVRRSFNRLTRKASESAMRGYRVEIRGLEHLKEASGAGSGVIVVAGHFFGSRLMRRALEKAGYPVMGVRAGRPLDWALGRFGIRFVRPRLLPSAAESAGGRVRLDDPDCTLKIVSRLRSGGLVTILLDSPLSRNTLRLPFLGGHFRFSTGFLEIARHTGCAVIPALSGVDGSAFTVAFLEPLRLLPAPAREDFVSANLPTLVSTLESWVLQYPDQWESWLSLEP